MKNYEQNLRGTSIKGAGSQFLNQNFNFNAFKMVMKIVVELDGHIRKPIMNNFMPFVNHHDFLHTLC